jgi:hypothetical protein
MHNTNTINATRTGAEIVNAMKKGEGFVSSPGDVITVEQTPGIISNRIELHLVGKDGTDARFALANKLAVWKWLKEINEMGGREVMVECDGIETPYAESMPYTHRFNS